MPHNQNKAASDEVDVVEIPPELVCRLCDGLIRDAVIIPCCGENYCDDCECTVAVIGVDWYLSIVCEHAHVCVFECVRC